MLGESQNALKLNASKDKTDNVHGGQNDIDIHLLAPNPSQPRKNFTKNSLNELANSIKIHGMIMPILARPDPDDGNMFQIVAGERRWRAAQIAKLHKVPVIINDVDDQSSSLTALIENIQREDLNPVEEAEAYDSLISNYKMTQVEVSLSSGKSRSYIANMVRLIKLPEIVKQSLVDGKITYGHARAILSSSKPKEILRDVIKSNLNVRQTELLIKKELNNKDKKNNKNFKRDINILDFEKSLSLATGLTVTIKDKNGKGSLIINYLNLEQLEEMASLLTVKRNNY